MKHQRPAPVVSIIIVTYNGSGYLNAAIKSIQEQTFTDWEVVIVDDGSTDESEALVKKIMDDRILFYPAGRIGRTGKLKNLGFHLCRGKFIAYLDHDDLWHPLKLEKQLMALKENPVAGFCLCGGYNFRNEGEPCEYFYGLREGKFVGSVFQLIFQSRISLWTQALLVRRTCVEQIGGFEEKRLFDDHVFITKLASRFEAVVIYDTLFFRRLHESNKSSANWQEGQKDGIEMIRKYWREGLLHGSIARPALFRSYIHGGEKYLKFHMNQKAFGQFFRSWQLRPWSIVAVRKIMKSVLGMFREKKITQIF